MPGASAFLSQAYSASAMAGMAFPLYVAKASWRFPFFLAAMYAAFVTSEYRSAGRMKAQIVKMVSMKKAEEISIY
jgi:hypothetical protein